MTNDRRRDPQMRRRSRSSSSTAFETDMTQLYRPCLVPRTSYPYNVCAMRLRELSVGCFGGGTGLPSLLGGLKNNPWLHANAVVTMFDSGGSSGQLRDELGV